MPSQQIFLTQMAFDTFLTPLVQIVFKFRKVKQSVARVKRYFKIAPPTMQEQLQALVWETQTHLSGVLVSAAVAISWGPLAPVVLLIFTLLPSLSLLASLVMNRIEESDLDPEAVDAKFCKNVVLYIQVYLRTELLPSRISHVDLFVSLIVVVSLVCIVEGVHVCNVEGVHVGS